MRAADPSGSERRVRSSVRLIGLLGDAVNDVLPVLFNCVLPIQWAHWHMVYLGAEILQTNSVNAAGVICMELDVEDIVVDRTQYGSVVRLCE